MRSILFLLLAWGALSCAGPQTGLVALRYSTITYPYKAPIRLYIGREKDRSNTDYFYRIDQYELDTFHKRFGEALQNRKLKILTHTATGNPVVVKLRNPFTVVFDSTQADIVMYMWVNHFEQDEVEVDRDQIRIWEGYGVAKKWKNLDEVSRVDVTIEIELKERGRNQAFHSFLAKGIALGSEYEGEDYERAMKRCEVRFYEHLLKMKQ